MPLWLLIIINRTASFSSSYKRLMYEGILREKLFDVVSIWKEHWRGVALCGQFSIVENPWATVMLFNNNVHGNSKHLEVCQESRWNTLFFLPQVTYARNTNNDLLQQENPNVILKNRIWGSKLMMRKIMKLWCATTLMELNNVALP